MSTVADPLSQWIEATTSTERGRIFLDNIGIDITDACCTALHITTFRDRLLDCSKTPSTKNGDRSINLANDAIVLGTLYLSGKIASLSPQEMTFVIGFDELLVDYWFDLSAAGGRDEIWSSEQLLEFIQDIDDLAPIIRHGATFRSRRPMVWLTTAAELTSALKGKHDKAAVARDLLGLPHFSEDQLLCRINLKPADIDWKQIRKPYCFDGGPNMVFRSNDAGEGFGRTIDLRTCKPALPEVLSPPIRLRPHHAPQKIGRLKKQSAFSWGALAELTQDARIKTACDELLGKKP